jgi:hypothetical protein
MAGQTNFACNGKMHINASKLQKMNLQPDNFFEWKNCIERKCGIPLTKDFAEKRIAALRDLKNEYTREFTALYGDAYRLQVIGWFEQSMI